MRRFAHLEKIEKTEFDWENNLLKKSLPKRAFVNPLTANFLLALELLLSKSLVNVKQIRRYFQL